MGIKSNGRFKIKGEDNHQKWDKKNYPHDCNSARECPKGFFQQETYTYKLVDKIIYTIDKCPHCKSRKTYHAWIQHHKSFVDNVWRSEQKQTHLGKLFAKFDLCLECQKEFIIEMFLWKRVEDEPTTP